MAAFTKKSSHNADFAKGGNTKMFGAQASEPQEAGVTRDPDDNDSAPGAKFAKGGSGKMFGFAGAEPAKSGMTSAR